MTITTWEELDDLPKGTIIRCEIEQYKGVYELTNIDECCSGWHTFDVFDGDPEVIDDYTPEFPAEVIGTIFGVTHSIPAPGD
jgi:hypothetical protein